MPPSVPCFRFHPPWTFHFVVPYWHLHATHLSSSTSPCPITTTFLILFFCFYFYSGGATAVLIIIIIVCCRQFCFFHCWRWWARPLVLFIAVLEFRLSFFPAFPCLSLICLLLAVLCILFCNFLHCWWCLWFWRSRVNRFLFLPALLSYLELKWYVILHVFVCIMFLFSPYSFFYA